MSEKKKPKKKKQKADVIRKADVLDAIDTCSQMRQCWQCGRNIGNGFSSHVLKVQRLLGKLLTGNTVKIK